MSRITMDTPMKVAPSGLPTWRRCTSDGLAGVERDVLSRKSCVTAMPMLAKESEVRSQARNVRSKGRICQLLGAQLVLDEVKRTQGQMVACHGALVVELHAAIALCHFLPPPFFASTTTTNDGAVPIAA